MGTEGKTPGDGQTAPFGDGDGETQAAGASSGAHDFVKDPNSHAPSSGGRDFTKESRPQQSGSPEQRTNQDDAAPGGTLPFGQLDAVASARKDADVDVAGTAKHTPFKLGGG